MRYMKYLALLTILMVPFAYSQAQVRVGIGIGVAPGYVAGPPVCAYGYYDYYPYACAPYGYYGADYFVDGVFIGAGPWYHWGHPAWYWNRGYYGRDWDHDRWYGHRDWDHDRWYGHRDWDDHRGYAYGHGYVRGDYGHDRGDHEFHGGQGFRGGESRGGGGFHGEGGFHGGGRR